VSTITGDVGTIDTNPQGFGACGVPPGCVVYTAGSLHVNDQTAIDDKAAADAARIHTAALGGAIAIPAQLGGQTYAAGLYSTGAANITGVLTLDAANDPNSVWIFQAASSIQTAISSQVVFINTAGTSPAQLACNVFWTAVSSADLLGPTFVGTVLANTSITVGAGVTVNGRLFAGTGNVTLINDTIIRPTCTTLPAGTGGTPVDTPVTTPAITPVIATPNTTG
jgi:type VI secretion system secreted protein VgrG